jgi:hypothetical protein
LNECGSITLSCGREAGIGPLRHLYDGIDNFSNIIYQLLVRYFKVQGEKGPLFKSFLKPFSYQEVFVKYFSPGVNCRDKLLVPEKGEQIAFSASSPLRSLTPNSDPRHHWGPSSVYHIHSTRISHRYTNNFFKEILISSGSYVDPDPERQQRSPKRRKK